MEQEDGPLKDPGPSKEEEKMQGVDKKDTNTHTDLEQPLESSSTMLEESSSQESKDPSTTSSEEGLPSYEVLRLRNIAEREVAFKNLGIMEAKEKLKPRPKPQPRGGHQSRRRTFEDDDDDEFQAPRTQRPRRMIREVSEVQRVIDRMDDQELKTKKSQISLRPRKKAINYQEEPVPKRDQYLYCDLCEDEYVDLCPFHPVETLTDVETLISINPSGIRKAGRGVFNKSDRTFKIGTLFGPYSGQVIPYKEYNKKAESGYAWELMDPDKTMVIGYVDPGKNPDPKADWLAMVNSANYQADQNIVAVQYNGSIMYRVCRPIPPGTEFLTYYGDEYSREMGINPDEFKKGKITDEYWDDLQLGDDEEIYDCEKCGMGFTEERLLQRHHCQKKGLKTMKSTTSRNPSARIPCSKCEKSFSSSNNAKLHMNMVHLRLKPFICTTCGKGFGKQSHLNRHIKTVHLKQKNFECHICQQRFSRNEALQRHMNEVHLCLKPFICMTCGKGFSQQSQLNTHIKMIHLKQKNFECHICRHRFVLNGTLQTHIQTVHLKIQSFDCTLCEYKTGWKNALKRHIICNHTREFSHKCQLCPKGFVTPKQLTEHVKLVHPNEWEQSEREKEEKKSFKCHLCTQAFTKKTGLKLHVQQIHGHRYQSDDEEE